MLSEVLLCCLCNQPHITFQLASILTYYKYIIFNDICHKPILRNPETWYTGLYFEAQADRTGISEMDHSQGHSTGSQRSQAYTEHMGQEADTQGTSKGSRFMMGLELRRQAGRVMEHRQYLSVSARLNKVK